MTVTSRAFAPELTRGLVWLVCAEPPAAFHEADANADAALSAGDLVRCGIGV
ncbi:MAG: hypothetical protein ACE5I7_18225 [Candidatus Binatia bacterium]